MASVAEDLAAVKTAADLSAVRARYFGKHGVITQKLNSLKEIADVNERKAQGQAINRQKQQIEQQLHELELKLLAVAEETIDPTLPPLPEERITLGRLHPVTYTIAEIERIFAKIGFYRVNYPEIEYEFFSFDSLNMPSSHPARDEFESFSVNGKPSSQYGKMVLSPHTSSGQVREMWRKEKPPVRMINIARCFRRNWDITHTPMFHQFEGLCVDRGINISHLKGAISHFAKEYFGYDVKIRLRPYHFQFTEPSFEIDTTCTLCRGTMRVKGEKCRICKSGWLELGGAGMVHPNVLKAGKIDTQVYSGWAFGFGVERVYMMKYQLNDLRRLYSGELDIYNQAK